MPPEVSVIVPHLNQPDHLGRFLASLHAQDFDMGRAEVIVVDNGSRALPREVVARHPAVALVEEPTPGPGPARNRGVALAKGPILAFADADCQVAPDWLPRILARFAADPGLAILGGDVRVYPQDPARPTMVEAYECVYAFRQKLYIEQQHYSITANMATRRAVFDAVGPFAGIDVSEDLDWGQRAARMGYRTVYDPEMLVRHPARHSLAELQAKWSRHISHHHADFVRGFGGQVKWVAKACVLPLSPLAEIPHLLTTDRLAGAAMRARAFGGLCAIRFWRARRMLAVMLDQGVKTASVEWNRK